jgi:hypothetical protein
MIICLESALVTSTAVLYFESRLLITRFHFIPLRAFCRRYNAQHSDVFTPERQFAAGYG